LFWKYFIALFGAVVLTLLSNGLSEVLFGYRDLTASLSRTLGAQAQSAAERIDDPLLDAARDHGFDQRAQKIALAKTTVAILGKCGMIRDAALKPKTAKPAVGQIEMDVAPVNAAARGHRRLGL
jgi:hypothetical protein